MSLHRTAGPRRRPRRPDSRRVEVVMTEAEYQLVHAAAAACPGRGVSVSRYVAEAALDAATAAAGSPRSAGSPRPPVGRGRRMLAPVVLAELADAVAAVNRVGNNLNQLTRHTHVTGEPPESTAAVQQRVLAALQHLAEITERTTNDLDGGDPR